MGMEAPPGGAERSGPARKLRESKSARRMRRMKASMEAMRANG